MIDNPIGLGNFFQGRNILITGGTGTIGSALVKKVQQYKPAVLKIYSRDETKQYQLGHQLGNPANLNCVIGDIRDEVSLGKALADIDIVFHAAALKHVPACEDNSFEAVKTNILGTENLIEQSIAKKVKLVVGISTDKAVNPTGIMGTTKLLAEKLLIAANWGSGKHRTAFSCVRLGNVAGARGSVIPLFLNQVGNQEPLTVTDPRMTRFIMLIDQAVGLLLKAVRLAVGGEIFILPMPSVRILDIAQSIANRYFDVTGKTIPVVVTGLRLGEKIHEELISPYEIPKIFRYENLLILPGENGHLPPGMPLDPAESVPLSSNDQPPLSQTDILEMVKSIDRLNILKWDY